MRICCGRSAARRKAPRCIAPPLRQAPALGEAWWGLADLKSGALDADDIATLERLLGSGGLDINQALHLSFALGKAQEDARQLRGIVPRLRSGQSPCPPGHGLTSECERGLRRSLDRLLRPRPISSERKGGAIPARAPIFVLGMPRAGSTLLEQMLASHPAIEGTAELPYIPQIAHELLAERWTDAPLPYPEILSHLDRDGAERLGQEYLAARAFTAGPIARSSSTSSTTIGRISG